jgi:hypothetical protein
LATPRSVEQGARSVEFRTRGQELGIDECVERRVSQLERRQFQPDATAQKVSQFLALTMSALRGLEVPQIGTVG